ncbi:MAG: NAD(P)/FAD-dependent oxidoreductase [Candidatus Saelkia tenebricola]|nr:NAD(P)/FAD-dependent oxidoreductase [Candidatus Saelkia tenebricola]
MCVYDVAVIGAGAAGTIAAMRVGLLKRSVVLVERNNSIGRKILLTGKQRCNITNTADVDTFIEIFGKQGRFLRSAFYSFFNHDLIDFFKTQGLMLKVERQGRVFPVTDKAGSIVEVLKRCLLENKQIKILYNMRLTNIIKKDDLFQLEMVGNDEIYAKKVILATGGASYKVTGSSGDGFRIAGSLGHTLLPLKPALVPLKTKESWVKQLQGISLKNIRIIFSTKAKNNKKIISNVGEMIFTHFGVSGPLVLDLSAKIVALLDECKEIPLFIDLKPGLTPQQIEKRLLNEFNVKSNMQLKSIMRGFLPKRLVPVFIDVASLSADKKASQISRKERYTIGEQLKALPLTVVGSLSLDNAMVTNGGVSTKDINPRTMESKVIPGVYFAGEIIDGCAKSGGYNLQQAFSTGFLAGESAGA